MINLETNPMVLLSVINTKLRDHYDNLEALCDDLDIDQAALETKLEGIDYHYDHNLNQFK